MRLAIVSRIGVVHRVSITGDTCAAATPGRMRKFVTANQCLVFKLPHCPLCFPSRDDYRRIIHGPLAA